MLSNVGRYLFSEHRRNLVIVFVVALLCRLAVFLILERSVDVGQINNASSDVAAYVTAAEAIRANSDFMTEAVYLFGPGYPLFLCFWRALLGTDPRVIIALQLVLSAFGSVLLALLALKITGNSRVAFVAGMLNALSLLSILLANLMLSETLFFVLVLSALLLYISALERENVWLCIIAGVLLSVAALTRSVGQFLALVLVLISLFHERPLNSGPMKIISRRLKYLLPVVAIMILSCVVWIARNKQLYNSPYLAGSNPEGITKLNLLIRADLQNAEFGDLLAAVRADVEREEALTNRGEQIYVERARELPKLLVEHPVTSAKIFVRNMIIYTNSEWGVVGLVFPEWYHSANRVSRWMESVGLNFRVTILFIVGLLILWRRRHIQILVILLGIYAYFALSVGFTAGQGMRVFYPGQIAWTIVLAYPLLSFYELIRDSFLARGTPESPDSS